MLMPRPGTRSRVVDLTARIVGRASSFSPNAKNTFAINAIDMYRTVMKIGLNIFQVPQSFSFVEMLTYHSALLLSHVKSSML